MSNPMWRYRGSFVELVAEQRSPAWFSARNCRITASVYEAILGKSRFTSKEEAIQRLLGKIPPKPENEAMRLGKENEDPLRDWLAKQLNTQITEPSLCLGLTWYDFPMSWQNNRLLSEEYPSQLQNPLHPNWFIGGSPDGEIYFENGEEANLEIKFTKRLYQPLQDYAERRKNGTWSPFPRYIENSNSILSAPFRKVIQKYYPMVNGAIDFFNHIWQSHFMQMQGCMAILSRKKCVYLVGSPKKRYVEMVPFDERYWRYFLYPSLVQAVETEIKPNMSEEQKTAFIQEVNTIIKLIPQDAEHMYPFGIIQDLTTEFNQLQI